MSGPPLKIGRDAPFPWFGGKRRVAPIVWRALGDVRGYVEPFAGSLAVLLRRPGGAAGVETVNDKDAYVCNFWRAVQADPVAVARYADWPVNETDLYARHRWLVSSGRERIAALEDDPEHYDAKVAGWWVWGVCCWIGSGWCSTTQPRQLPHLSNPGQGVNRQLPRRGVNRKSNAALDAGGGGTREFPSPGLSRAVGEWALAHGEDERLRIVLCGHEGEHEMPGWYCHAYSATGAYVGADGSSDAQAHRHRERIWFSPGSLPVDLYHASGIRGPLFGQQPINKQGGSTA